MSEKVLVACVGNVLRGDDGFGVAVARRLEDEGQLPEQVDVIETGIGGLDIVRQLMDGYATLIVIDAIDGGAAPGTVFVLVPRVAEPAALSLEQWQADFSNMHLTEPSRVFVLAKALGVLPGNVLLIGCQPQNCLQLGEGLSPPVEAAVEIAARRVREVVAELVGEVEVVSGGPG